MKNKVGPFVTRSVNPDTRGSDQFAGKTVPLASETMALTARSRKHTDVGQAFLGKLGTRLMIQECSEGAKHKMVRAIVRRTVS
jgi:hypothetical protein